MDGRDHGYLLGALLMTGAFALYEYVVCPLLTAFAHMIYPQLF